MSDERAPAPWTGAQARAVAACDAVAAAVVAAAWYGAREQGSLQDQVPWLNLGVLGLLVAVVANGFLFLLARRAVGQRRLEVLPDVPPQLRRTPAPDAAAPRRWLPGTVRVHAEGCPMIAGKPSKPVSAAQVRSKKLTDCELCG